jgi:hypothetical protein
MQFKTDEGTKQRNPLPSHEATDSEMNDVGSWVKYVAPQSDDRNNKSPTITQIENNHPDNDHTHAGFVYYLYQCWAKEKGVCLRPDIIWYTIVSETAREILGNPSKYKHLFSKTTGKQDMILTEMTPHDISIDHLDKLLDEKVTNKEFKQLITGTQFKSQPEEFDLALKMSFAYMGKAYFNYMTTLCGISSVTVEGDKQEWFKLTKAIIDLNKFIPNLKSYYQKCCKTVNDICYYSFDAKLKPQLNKFRVVDNGWRTHTKTTLDKYNSPEDFFSQLFMIKENCGSGHPYSTIGWFSNLYMGNHSVLYDFPTHINYVPYRQIDYEKYYYKATGLTYSIDKENVLHPHYGVVIHEVDEETFNRIK